LFEAPRLVITLIAIVAIAVIFESRVFRKEGGL